MLSDKQIQAANMLLEKKKKTDIARDLGIQRSTLYSWIDNEEFKLFMDKRREELLKATMNDMKSDIGVLIDQVKKIALTSDNENTRLTACQMILDRVLGKAVAKSEIELNTNDNATNEVDLDSLLEDKDSNVIDLDKIAK